jgi:hypothetical protein
MPGPALRARCAAPFAAFALVLGTAGPAAAFDTGHHFDLTAAALGEHRFTRSAVRQVQLAGWMTDYMNTPVFPDRRLARQFEALHFDDLGTDQAVRHRWAGLVANSRRAAIAAAEAGDVEGVLTVLGMSLHAAQDFYSHSNWVEIHPRAPGAPFRTETYFSDPAPGAPLRTALAPGRSRGPDLVHGDYYRGMNKDSYVRQGWREAYVFAHVGTVEWVAAVRGWAEGARPGIWAECAAWRPSPLAARALRTQVVMAERLSAFGSAGFLSGLPAVRRLIPTGVDGHWKGNGSGSLLGTVLASLGGRSPRASAVAERAIALVPRIVEGLDRGKPDPMRVASIAASAGGAVVPAPAPAARAIVLRTLEVRATGAALDPPIGRADLYSRIVVAGHAFTEAPQVDRQVSNPFWTSLAVVPRERRRIPITYSLFDQDFPDADDAVALTPDGPLRFWYEPETGTVGGLPPGATARPSRTGGGLVVTVRGHDAMVRLRLTSAALAPAARRLESRGPGI